jgi:hypothetical protein
MKVRVGRGETGEVGEWVDESTELITELYNEFGS